MENQVSNNPLKQYFRQIKTYIKLPSGTTYYAENAIDFTDTGEVAIYPMTGQDELTLKNPDALLNGQALVDVIRSCVPAIKNPKMLLSNDVDALITAIRFATFNDKIETELNCPSCNAHNSFNLNLQHAIDGMTFLEPEYVVNLDTGLSVFVKPYEFNGIVKGMHMKFEQSKINKVISDPSMPEEQRIKLISATFKDMAVMTYELIADSVVKVVDESKGVNVTDKLFIKDYLKNVDKDTIDKISVLINDITKVGIKKTFTAKCEKCEHEWETEIDFNPVNFS